MLFDGKIFVLRKVFHMISHYLGRNGMLQSYFFQRESVNEVLVEQEKSLHASSKSKLFFFFLGGGGALEEKKTLKCILALIPFPLKLMESQKSF